MKQNDPIVIVGMVRTPIGSFNGGLKEFSAPQLGAAVIKEAVIRAHLKPIDIQEVLMGCVLPAGLGQAPARQAMILAGIPDSAGATTINKVCGSGMKSIMLASDSLTVGSADIVVAGGMESMSNAPREHMLKDGLEDPYEKKSMGVFAEETAKKYGFTREAQDEFTLRSLTRAQKASQDGSFDPEIIAMGIINKDELPQKARPEKIPQLKPAFVEGGTVTAANSSSISDGAAALVLMRESEAQKRNIKPLAKIMGYATHSQSPAWFTTAPVGAIQKLYKKTGWTKESVDLFEINEAFAVVTLVAIKELNLSVEKVNIHGGACALGHPIGASGARIVVTLISALQKYGLKRGIAALCIGGGEATAIGVELC